jgi:uncharacterized SAM-binding protein YcdF (DUF218 family)
MSSVCLTNTSIFILKNRVLKEIVVVVLLIIMIILVVVVVVVVVMSELCTDLLFP